MRVNNPLHGFIISQVDKVAKGIVSRNLCCTVYIQRQSIVHTRFIHVFLFVSRFLWRFMPTERVVFYASSSGYIVHCSPLSPQKTHCILRTRQKSYNILNIINLFEMMWWGKRYKMTRYLGGGGVNHLIHWWH